MVIKATEMSAVFDKDLFCMLPFKCTSSEKWLNIIAKV